MELYPLKFKPLFHYRIWGGDKLNTLLNKNCSRENIGESWEISDVEDNQTVVSEGPLKGKTLKQLIQKYKSNFVGEKVYSTFGREFPLLIKFIDAKKDLSIQVHPNDELAKERHNSFGKNEMWYVMEASENAKLIVGFNKKITKEEYTTSLKKATITDILNVENVVKGDAFYIPTGRVHAIGANVLLAEIQQTSNITYRIYDYERIDNKTGKKRELHEKLALEAIDFKKYDSYKTAYSLEKNTSNKLVHSPYFKTNIIEIVGEMSKDYSNLNSFVIYICVEGNSTINYNNKIYNLNKGETILLPATINNINIIATSSKILEVSL
ncbi:MULTISPECIES: type I phosphomannose isomerase catalytic subunit [Flavobacteriaceae]|uniref:Phosphohexomutase n=2 Tax=Flavobacteriaceae TaxID=49546 RepID=A0A4Y8AWS9_9FLAO|nr:MULTISPECIES: type I phosphomannose isomerase catalytic subunit [Flavobacteriaceae]TEW76492.1 mannose-6-phosphate isomerase [Gramella jeungdoensis]